MYGKSRPLYGKCPAKVAVRGPCWAGLGRHLPRTSCQMPVTTRLMPSGNLARSPRARNCIKWNALAMTNVPES